MTEHTAGLVYQGQSGALNESVSDVFATCLKQRLLGQARGRGRLADRRRAVPARRQRARAARHGRARDGVRRPGARPRPAAGPHGLLRRDRPRTTAASTSTPGSRTGPSTWPRSRSAARPPRARAGSGTTPSPVARSAPGRTSPAFAAATVAAAGAARRRGRGGVGDRRRHPGRVGRRAGAARAAVEAPRDASASAVPAASPGRTTAGAVDLDTDDDRAAELADLVSRIDLRTVAGGHPHPDMYVYDFDLCGSARHRPRAAPHRRPPPHRRPRPGPAAGGDSP